MHRHRIQTFRYYVAMFMRALALCVCVCQRHDRRSSPGRSLGRRERTDATPTATRRHTNTHDGDTVRTSHRITLPLSIIAITSRNPCTAQRLHTHSTHTAAQCAHSLRRELQLSFHCGRAACQTVYFIIYIMTMHVPARINPYMRVFRIIEHIEARGPGADRPRSAATYEYDVHGAALQPPHESIVYPLRSGGYDFGYCEAVESA